MKRFEYKTYVFEIEQTLFFKSITNTDELDKKINALGRDGWELVTSVNNLRNGFSREIVLLFKRERR